ncbi:uncharacterized protein LOC125178995, partial [Hyalella azteca]|uniref:Uncharacterized protein LOC125178995 n=1 Tax=Hyalella azteca TaxID=294128 RepID=A0A979FUA7_HYAAZ
MHEPTTKTGVKEVQVPAEEIRRRREAYGYGAVADTAPTTPPKLGCHPGIIEMQNLLVLFTQVTFVSLYAIGICCFQFNPRKFSAEASGVDQTVVYFPIEAPLVFNAVLHLSYLTARLLRNCNITSGTLLRCLPSHELFSKVFTLIIFPSAL